MKYFEKFLLVIFVLNTIGAGIIGHWDAFFGWSTATLLQLKVMNLF